MLLFNVYKVVDWKYNKINKQIIKQQSLNLLKTNALKAHFNVKILLVQKLINKNEVIPINSQPKINVIQLPAHTNKIIESTNIFKKKIKLIIFNSFLIYEKAYKYTPVLIQIVKKLKLKLIKSIYNVILIGKLLLNLNK